MFTQTQRPEGDSLLRSSESRKWAGLMPQVRPGSPSHVAIRRARAAREGTDEWGLSSDCQTPRRFK